MSITVTCRCGKAFSTDQESAGDWRRCPACGGSVRVPETLRETAALSAAAMIRFTCPCGQPCQAHTEHAGRKTRCPSCDAILSIPFTDRVAPRVFDDPEARRRDLTDRPSRARIADEREAVRDDAEPDRYDIRRRPSKKKKQGSRAWIGVLALGLVLVAAGGVIIWLVLRNKISEDFDLVPRDAQVFITVKVADVLESELGRKLFDSIPDKAGLREAEQKLGMKLHDIERLTIVLMDFEKEDGWGLVHTKADYDESKIKAAMGAPLEQTYNGKAYYLMPINGVAGPLAVHFAGPRLLIVGPERGVRHCLDLPAKPSSSGPLVDALKLASKGKSHAAMGINISDAKFRGFVNRMGIAGGGINNPIDKFKAMAIAVHLSRNVELTVQIEFTDSAFARGVANGTEAEIREAQRTDPTNLPPERALQVRMMSNAKSSRSGSTVEVEMEFDQGAINTLIDLVRKNMGQRFGGFGN